LVGHDEVVKADPDTVDAKVPWGNGPLGWSVGALFMLALAIGTAVDASQSDANPPVVELIAAISLGIGYGVALWAFDRWWGQRPRFRFVSSERYSEWPRQVPTFALFLIATIGVQLWLGVYSPSFLFAVWAPVYLLIMPGWSRRRAARRTVRLNAMSAGD
jgi:hypothetical protein